MDWCVYFIVLWLGYYEPTKLEHLDFRPELEKANSLKLIGQYYDTVWLDEEAKEMVGDTIWSFSIYGRIVERGMWDCTDMAKNWPQKMVKDTTTLTPSQRDEGDKK